MPDHYFMRIHGISSYDADSISSGEKNLKYGGPNRHFIPADSLVSHWNSINNSLNHLDSPPSFPVGNYELFKKFVAPKSQADHVDKKITEDILKRLYETMISLLTKSLTSKISGKNTDFNKSLNELGASKYFIIEGEVLEFVRNLTLKIFDDVANPRNIAEIVEKHLSRNSAVLNMLFFNEKSINYEAIGKHLGYSLLKDSERIYVEPAVPIFLQQHRTDPNTDDLVLLEKISNDIYQSLYYWSVLLDISSLKSKFLCNNALLSGAITRICHLATTNTPNYFHTPSTAYSKLHLFLIDFGKEPPDSMAPLFFKPIREKYEPEPLDTVMERIAKQAREGHSLRGDFFLHYIATKSLLTIPEWHQGTLQDVIGAVPSLISTSLTEEKF